MIKGEQAGMLGVPQKVHTQKSTGTPVTANMDAYEKLQEIEAEAELNKQPATPAEKRILAELGDKPVHVDEIVHNTKLPITEVNAALSLLEIKGDIKEVGSKHFIRNKPETPAKATPGTATPKARAKRTTSTLDLAGGVSHEDAAELVKGLDLRRESLADLIDKGKATLDTIKESLDPKIAKLTELIPTNKEGKGELAYITKGKYEKVWGKEPPTSIVEKGKVRWEYCLDTIAQELHLEPKAQAEGKAPDEYLKGLIEQAKDTKAMITATESEIAGDERTLEAIERLKGDIKTHTGKVTAGPYLHTLAKPTRPAATKPERKAQTILAGEAQALINKIQSKRTATAIAVDKGITAGRVLTLKQVNVWAKHPNRLDLRGIDTANRRPRLGVFTDRGGTRLTRVHHRGFVRAPGILARRSRR